MDEGAVRRSLNDPEIAKRLQTYLSERPRFGAVRHVTNEPIPPWLLKIVMAEPSERRIRK